MEKINLKTWLESMAGQATRTKIWLTWRYVIELWIAAAPVIVVISWIILAFLLHKYELYKFSATDILPIFGIIAAVTAAFIAESQLHSWKQEKLLDRLEALYLLTDKLWTLCNSLLTTSAWYHANAENREFTDTDIDHFVELASMGYVDKEAINATCLNISHQILFIQKLLTNRTFKLNKSTEAHAFLNKTDLFCKRISRLADAIDLLEKHQKGAIRYQAEPGIHKAILEDVKNSKESLNMDRNGNLPQDRSFIMQPHDRIKFGAFLLIKTLRV